MKITIRDIAVGPGKDIYLDLVVVTDTIGQIKQRICNEHNYSSVQHLFFRGRELMNNQKLISYYVGRSGLGRPTDVFFLKGEKIKKSQFNQKTFSNIWISSLTGKTYAPKVRYGDTVFDVIKCIVTSEVGDDSVVNNFCLLNNSKGTYAKSDHFFGYCLDNGDKFMIVLDQSGERQKSIALKKQAEEKKAVNILRVLKNNYIASLHSLELTKIQFYIMLDECGIMSGYKYFIKSLCTENGNVKENNERALHAANILKKLDKPKLLELKKLELTHEQFIEALESTSQLYAKRNRKERLEYLCGKPDHKKFINRFVL